jgi:trehalose-6-phosphate synthase
MSGSVALSAASRPRAECRCAISIPSSARRRLIPHYRAADAALLTPLRDGMNFVAKEFVASRVNDDGALILSEFASAAEELIDALLVNPYDINQIADRLKCAVDMSATERAEG